MLIGQLSHYFFGITIFLTSLFLVLLVLVQRGRGGGIAGALGGAGGQSAFGTKAGDLFTRITVGVAAFWILLCCLAISFLKTPTFSTGFSGGDGSKMESNDKPSSGTTDGGAIGGEPSSSPTGGITLPAGDGAAAPAATTTTPAIDPATAPSVTTPAATTPATTSPAGDTAPKPTEPAPTTPAPSTPATPEPAAPAPTQPTEPASTTPATTPEAGTPKAPAGDGAPQPTTPNN